MRHRLAAFIAGLSLCAGVVAQEAKVGALTVSQARARFTVSGQTAGGGFMKLDNQGVAADRLVGGRAPVCERVEMHTMRLDGNVMRMRQLDAIELPAGKTVELKSSGLHLMFVGLKAPLKAGEKFPLTLRFEKAGEVTVQVLIEGPASPAQDHHHKH
jgi:copper(I)-binding protein